MADALRVRQRRVTAAPWNGAFEPFAEAAAVVIRATWDYHQAPEAYQAWLDRLDSRRTFNDPALIRWNLSKSHVLELGRRGARVPRSMEAAAEPAAIGEALDALGVREGVIKPLIGASGFGVERVTRDTLAADLARARSTKTLDRVLVQELMTEIRDGELAGVFFESAFSHGLRRRPAAGEFRINSRYGGTMEPATLSDATIDAMTTVLHLLPEPPLYARIDGLVRDGAFVLMEVEVNEPGLGLDLAPGSADRFAAALVRRL